jgi:very-short-patch-repair endonuclease
MDPNEKHRPETFARTLRQQPTPAERLLWSKLRNRQLDGIKFRRQQPIGEYIVDFVSFDKRLIIEVDGGQHSEHGLKARDNAREQTLTSSGYRLLRFWNNEVLQNIEGVVEKIRQALQ